MVWQTEEQQPLDCSGSCSHFRTELHSVRLFLFCSSSRSRAMPPKAAAAKASATASASSLPSGAATAASPASSSGAGAIVELAASGVTRAKRVSDEISHLLQAQKQAREEQKRLAAAVKNARRRRSRLTKRARQLSTEDLLTVVALRESERATRSRDPTPAALADAAVEDMGDRVDAEDPGAASPSFDEDAAEREEPGRDDSH